MFKVGDLVRLVPVRRSEDFVTIHFLKGARDRRVSGGAIGLVTKSFDRDIYVLVFEAGEEAWFSAPDDWWEKVDVPEG